jgi:hypothetical protein
MGRGGSCRTGGERGQRRSAPEGSESQRDVGRGGEIGAFEVMEEDGEENEENEEEEQKEEEEEEDDDTEEEKEEEEE